MSHSALEETLSYIGLSKPKRHEWDNQTISMRIKEGFPFEAVERIRDMLQMDNRQMAQILSTSSKTLSRKKHAGHLTSLQSDRLYRLVRILALATEILGRRESAVVWLQESNRALGNVSPLALLDTDSGAQEVENVLERIRHGIYS